MCYVTATELKNNLSFYLEKSKEENVYVTKNKQIISVLTNPQLQAFFELTKMIEEIDVDKNVNMSDEDIICEAIEKKCDY